jgi:hypothetical protein
MLGEFFNIKCKSFFDVANSIQTGAIGKGRRGYILTDGYIVRQTTPFSASYPIPEWAALIADTVHAAIEMPTAPKFNNMMVEFYGDKYKFMGYHSDIDLDLADNSYIGIVIAYANLDLPPNRGLTIKCKLTGTTRQLTLEHLKCFMFSTTENKKYVHKIDILQPGQECCIITLRTSKTHVTDAEKISTADIIAYARKNNA